MPSSSKGTSTLVVAAASLAAAVASACGRGGVGEAVEGQSRLALLGQRLDGEAALHLGEERVHAFGAGRAAADGGAEAGGAGVAAGHRQQRGRLAPGVVERIEVEAAVATEDVVHLHEAAGVAGAQAEDHLGRRLVDGLAPPPSRGGSAARSGLSRGSGSRVSSSGRSRQGPRRRRPSRRVLHPVPELQIGLGLQEHVLLGRLLGQQHVEFHLLAGRPGLVLHHAVGS